MCRIRQLTCVENGYGTERNETKRCTADEVIQLLDRFICLCSTIACEFRAQCVLRNVRCVASLVRCASIETDKHGSPTLLSQHELTGGHCEVRAGRANDRTAHDIRCTAHDGYVAFRQHCQSFRPYNYSLRTGKYAPMEFARRKYANNEASRTHYARSARVPN